MMDHISVEPIVDLENTARSIGSIIGVQFEKDLSGDYEEFPAFVAKSASSEYVLLGNPDPEYDFGGVIGKDYELIVNDDAVQDHGKLISNLIEKLSVGGVKCRVQE